MLQDKKIGIIGFGNMGEAVVKGLLERNIVPRSNISVSDNDSNRSLYAKSKYNVNFLASASALAGTSDIIIIAVKPQDLKALSLEIVKDIRHSALVISILAGVTTKKLEALLKNKRRVIRVMPNMPAKIGWGVSALALGKSATDEDRRYAVAIFKSVGEVIELQEGLIDAVTAVSGSGPAYFFYIVELLTKSGIELGLDPHTAKSIATRTLSGSARLLEGSTDDAGYLRKKVTSKGGTTEAAFKAFQKRKFEQAFSGGIHAAAKRAKELSRG